MEQPAQAITVESVKARAQHQNWVFTFNYGKLGQPTETDVRLFFEDLEEKAFYAVAGFEVAPTTGQQHLQGYVQFNSKQRLTQCKKFKHAGTVCWFPAKGDEEDNELYCTKPNPDGSEKEILRIGDKPRVIDAGKRVKRDHGRALQCARDGMLDALADEDPQMYLQFYRTLEEIAELSKRPPKDLHHSTKHIWIYGPTGTGKSRAARHVLEELGGSWVPKAHNKWFSKKDMNKNQLIDDLGLETGKILVNFLKQWLDIYAFAGEYKGGVCQGRPRVFVITSNYHPHEMFGGTKDYEPIMRRLEVIYVGPPDQKYEGGQIEEPGLLSGLIGHNWENAKKTVIQAAKRAKLDTSENSNDEELSESEDEEEEVREVRVEFVNEKPRQWSNYD